MSNLLGYLTGRTTFVTPGWSASETGVSYPVLTKLREYLGLNVETSDWRVASVLALLEQDQRLENMLPGFTDSSCGSDKKLGRLNYMGSLWSRPADVWVGGTHAPDTQGPPVLLHEPSVWPAGDVWRLTPVNASNALIEVSHERWVVPCSVEASSLRVAWPEGIGWRGTITLDGEWTGVTVTHVPVYPVDAVAEGLASLKETPLILQQTELFGAWKIAANSSEKVSTIAAAIVRMSAQVNGR